MTYDYTHNKIGASFQECAVCYHPTPRINPYRNVYNTITGNNYILMKIALIVRAVPEPETPEFIQETMNNTNYHLAKNSPH